MTLNELKFTKEQGIYAYIYLDGKFVGQNQTGDENALSDSHALRFNW